jgi:uncharacterized protein YneF (UPF0154 family)
MSMKELRQNDMMAHLLDSLDAGKDIGHYGRLVFAMIARHYLDDKQLIAQLSKNPRFDETQAAALVAQVKAKDYNPPRPQKIREWQQEQDFPICPSADPDGCNVYRNLKLPQGVYENIQEYYEQKVSPA